MIDPEEKVSEKKIEEKPKTEAKAEHKETGASKETGKKKRKKISRMALPEVEAELKVLKEKMGGFQSAFAQHLLARKKVLTS